MREQRETSFKAAHLLTQNFATLASGILIGMSEGVGAKHDASKRKTKAARGREIAKRAPAARFSAKGATVKTAKRPKARKRARAATTRNAN